MYIQYILYYIEHTFENYYFYVSIFFCYQQLLFSQGRSFCNEECPRVTNETEGRSLLQKERPRLLYFSLGRIILSRIATIAAGTIPEPPKTSWSS